MPNILIALGANLGDRGETLQQAIEQLAAMPELTLLAQSELLVTKPVGGPSGQPDFLNSAAKFSTELTPEEVHQRLIDVEQNHGRVRVQRWGARKLDLDLLLYDEQLINTAQLTVPHPRMSFRRFVMQPAAEVAAEMRHPDLNTTIGEIWQHLSQSPPVVEIAALPGPAVKQLCDSVQSELGESFVSCANFSWASSSSKEALLQSARKAADTSAIDRSLPPGNGVTILPWWYGLASILQQATVPKIDPAFAPRLTIYWNRPDNTFGDTEKNWWSQEEKNGLQAQLAQAVQENVRTPRLWLDGNDLPSAVTEAAAAIQAMQG
ncbi:2-amino-4-hydroxy-6-hydroxymethyldihydropteridine diphosphokinase [Bremerella sp. T1]|uniref:2-amino-4-hydroxy-6- hydroxymethyldihydropteridine diphosphokinase n=1 Tax=Bremerella sp. TYQ1 TaxID=3119568 RepID=UPI001CCBCDC6|nr:2-amino-4-hydroxy-6-hydroxymethyldihydropteridine diphosphokinase [Bremerella volcania]UBM35152.1 2-amino-4-hydroxy-6-hydroxymethyldihydropteridine diphosphokinase [Bremerella volcania]